MAAMSSMLSSPAARTGVGSRLRKALKQDALHLVFREESPHVLQQLRWPAVAESGVVQEGVPLLPLGFAVVFAKMIFEPLVGVLVLEVDGQQE